MSIDSSAETIKSKRTLRGPRLGIPLTMILALMAAAAILPAVSSIDPMTQRLEEDLQPPSWEHVCGQDKLGRDVFARLLTGASISLGIGITVVGAVTIPPP